jgi:ZIP family zinc transporter
MITYFTMAIHNLPEGISVAVTTASDISIGVSLCCAILIHNILEGMIIALPLWRATESTFKVVILTLINGLMEPLGVLIAWALAGTSWINSKSTVSSLLSVVGGLMIGISCFELIPSSRDHMLLENTSLKLLVIWILTGALFGAVILGSSDMLMHYLL